MKTDSKYIASTSTLEGRIADLLDGRTLKIRLGGVKEKKALEIWGQLTKRTAAICHLFDMDDPGSEVCVLNASKTDIETSDEFKQALRICEAYLIRTGNLFDISSGSGDKLDFSIFTRAYIVRELASIVRKAGVKDALLDLDREVVWAIGNQPYSKGWTLALIDPETEDEAGEFTLEGTSAVICWNGGVPEVIFGKDPLDTHVFAQVRGRANANLVKDMSAMLSITSVQKYD